MRVSKKRPSKIGWHSSGPQHSATSKWEPAYWRRRLFKNTYTHNGRRFQIRNWCVKIQYLGKRRTLSLISGDLARAAAEACEAYRKIVIEGWDGAAVSKRSAGLRPGGAGNRLSAPGRRPAHGSIQHDPARVDAAYWKQRLIRRQYI